jgi:hypothetical protein
LKLRIDRLESGVLIYKDLQKGHVKSQTLHIAVLLILCCVSL